MFLGHGGTWGGKFDIGQLSFGESVKGWLIDVEAGAREAVLFVTYHWSRGDKHRGCRGFDYDVADAKKVIGKLRGDIAEVFEGSRLWPILIGLETDTDSLIVHSNVNDEEFDICELGGLIDEDLTVKIQNRLSQMFPSMSATMLFDLATLLEGNRRHVIKVITEGRSPEELRHCEKVLAFGQGFDWIHELNEAFIVGPFSDNKVFPVITAAKLLIENKREARIQNEQVVLLVCMPYTNKLRYYKNLARRRALHLAKIALEGIRHELPDYADFFVPMVCTINMESRILEEINLAEIAEFADYVEAAA